MSYVNKLSEISLASRIGYSKAGIRLVRPGRDGSHRNDATSFTDTGFLLNDLLEQPYSVFFFYADSIVTIANQYNERFIEAAIETAIGKHIYHVIKSKKAVQTVIENNTKILTEKNIQFFNEDSNPEEAQNVHCLSIKMPWYDDNKLVGVFGCSVYLNIYSVSDTLDQLQKFTQMFPRDGERCINQINKSVVNNVYLSPREYNILHHTIRGKSAKQIASILNLSARTIEAHLNNIKLKTQSNSKSELIDKSFDHFYQRVTQKH